MQLYGLKDVCSTEYGYINHSFLSVFIERWHIEMSSYHLLLNEMSITLGDISCLLHLMTTRRLLYHSKIRGPEALDLIVNHLRVDLVKAQEEIDDTRGCHTIFSFHVNNYVDHLHADVDVTSDYACVTYHRVCALRSYFIILIGTTIYVDKREVHVDVVYIYSL